MSGKIKFVALASFSAIGLAFIALIIQLLSLPAGGSIFGVFASELPTAPVLAGQEAASPVLVKRVIRDKDDLTKNLRTYLLVVQSKDGQTKPTVTVEYTLKGQPKVKKTAPPPTLPSEKYYTSLDLNSPIPDGLTSFELTVNGNYQLSFSDNVPGQPVTVSSTIFYSLIGLFLLGVAGLIYTVFLIVKNPAQAKLTR